MVKVRKRAAVNYAEPRDIEGLESDDEASEEELEGPKAARRKVTPSRAPRARKRQAELHSPPLAADGEETTLLDIVKKHGTSISVAAKDWVDSYKSDRAAATAQLLSLMLQSCGGPGGLSGEDVEEGEVDALKASLDKRAMEDGLEPSLFTAKGQKNFRANYLEMWDKVIREAHAADLLFDQFLLDRCVNLVIALNTSVVRDFRRVATLTAVQLITSWIHVTQTLMEARSTAQRQLAAEEKKAAGGRAAQERAAAFRRTVERSHSRIQELQSYTDALFQGVFSHRFRDCDEEIRACCIEGIGTWIRLLPSVFLTDQYLKYLAWALSDKDALVRRAAVAALLSLYSQRDNVATLHDFTERFLQRFTELLYDRDDSVAIKGVQLITLLVRLDELPTENVQEVYRLLGDESHGIRHAASELVASMLEEQGRRALEAKASSSAGKAGSARKGRGASKGSVGASGGAAGSHSAAELQLAGLLAVEQALGNERLAAGAGAGGEGGEEPEAVAPLPLGKDVVFQVVDALFERVPVLSDWRLLVQWLGHDQAEDLFGEAGMTNLAHTLRAALVRATGGQLLANGPPEKKVGAAGRERQAAQASARQEATLVLIKELPSLLRKVQTQAEQAAALVSCIPEMQLDIYALKREERAFNQLAKTVKDLFVKAVDPGLAVECTRALVHCSKEGPDAIRDAAQLVLTQAGEEAAAKLAAAAAAVGAAAPGELAAAVEAYEEDAEEEDQLLFDVRTALLRLAALLGLEGAAAARDDVYDALNLLVEGLASGQRPLPLEAARDALLCSLLLLMWCLQGLATDSPGAAAVADLSQKASLFASQLDSISADAGFGSLQATVSKVQADLYTLLCSAKLRAGPAAEAGLRPSDEAVEAFWQPVEQLLLRAMDEEEEEDPQAVARLLAEKASAAKRVGQLVVCQTLKQSKRLAAHLISHWGSQEAEVDDVIKEVCRELKRSRPDDLPAIYLAAMQHAHARCGEPTRVDDYDNDAERSAAEGERMKPLLVLGLKVAQQYAGFNASAPALYHLAVEGAKYALAGAPARLDFLHGAAFFAQRLPPGQCERARQEVEAAAEPQSPPSEEEAQEEESPWGLYYEFLTILTERAAKAKAKPALKKPAAAAPADAAAGEAAAAAPAGTVASARPVRKISFAPALAAAAEPIEESDEEEERSQLPEEIEQASEEEEEREQLRQPAGNSAKRDGRGRLARMSSPTALLGSQARGGRSAAAKRAGKQQQRQQLLQVQPEEEEPEEAEEPQHQASDGEGAAAAAAAGVFPTEEQLPVPRAQRKQQQQRRPSRLKPILLDTEEDEEPEQLEQQESDDDLPEIRGRNDKQVVAAAPAVAAAKQQQPQQQEAEEEDSSDEEEQRARRRRRR